MLATIDAPCWSALCAIGAIANNRDRSLESYLSSRVRVWASECRSSRTGLGVPPCKARGRALVGQKCDRPEPPNLADKVGRGLRPCGSRSHHAFSLEQRTPAATCGHAASLMLACVMPSMSPTSTGGCSSFHQGNAPGRSRSRHARLFRGEGTRWLGSEETAPKSGGLFMQGPSPKSPIAETASRTGRTVRANCARVSNAYFRPRNDQLASATLFHAFSNGDFQ